MMLCHVHRLYMAARVAVAVCVCVCVCRRNGLPSKEKPQTPSRCSPTGWDDDDGSRPAPPPKKKQKTTKVEARRAQTKTKRGFGQAKSAL